MNGGETLDLFGEADGGSGGGEGPADTPRARGERNRAVAPPASRRERTVPTARPGRGVGSDEQSAAAPLEPPVLTVSQVNRAVRAMMEREIPPLWISGEVANWTRARSGHCYFTLKDDQAQLRAVIWRRDAVRLPLDLEDGMRVRGLGSLTLYEARGEFQFSVREIAGEEGEGLWRLAFERLRKKLEEEGLLDPARKRALPPFPRTVGVVTSTSGAAIRDILTVIQRRAPWTRILVRGARVQGEGAAANVAAAIRTLAGSGRVDVIIVGRGGGSIEDLWAFNEEVVARAIAASPVPVISAVGHEVDVTIADLVADLRAPTPSAGAEAAVQDGEALLDILRRIRPRLARGLRRGVELRRLGVDARRARLRASARNLIEPRRHGLRRQAEAMGRAMSGLVPPRRERLRRQEERLLRGVHDRLPRLRMSTQRMDERLSRTLTRMLEVRRGRLAEVAGRIETLSPLGTLRRGYGVPLDSEGNLIRTVGDLPAGRGFVLRLVDGRVTCESHGPVDDEVGGEGTG